MRHLTPRQRVEAYRQSACGQKWPDSVPWVGSDDRIYGVWILGQDYRNKTPYYGAHPPNYLERVLSFFPDMKAEPAYGEVMHLFSGSLPPGTPGIRVDINKKTKPDLIADAHCLSHELRGVLSWAPFSLITADPPYSVEDAEHYGTVMIRRNIVLQECWKVLAPGGWIVWLDQVLPMYKKTQLRMAGAIGMIRSTNHRFRVVTFFQKPRYRIEIPRPRIIIP